MSSRQYIKRVWRVPKDRGPAELLAAVIVKSLRKHGWPASACANPPYSGYGFLIFHVDYEADPPDDFCQAVDIACRIAARTYRVDIDQYRGRVYFQRNYVVTAAGTLKETNVQYEEPETLTQVAGRLARSFFDE